MEIRFHADALADLETFDKALKFFFDKHIQKIAKMPPRRHLSHGIPCNVEDVTKQARFVYKIKEGTLYVIRYFATHKEYEKWYLSFKNSSI